MWTYGDSKILVGVLVGWSGRRLTLEAGRDSVCLYWICSFSGMLERSSVWNKGGPTYWLHYDDQVSTGLRNNE